MHVLSPIQIIQQNIKIARLQDLLAIFLYEWSHVDGLVQERRYSIANALELCLSCTNPSV